MNYLIISLTIILLLNLNYHYLTILQQNHYKNHLMKYYIKKYYQKYLLWLITFLIFILFYKLTIIKKLILYIYFTCVFMYYLINQKKKILKLKITKRIKRIIILILITNGIFLINIKYILFSINILLLIHPLLNILVLEIDKPIENLINKIYITNAKKIIKENKDLIKIAITGSYGKTSTKNIIYQLLKNDYLTVSTPKSYNTLLGVTKTINEQIDSTTQIFIYEAGATTPGDIKEIVKLIKPDIAIITDIGMQHLESFKTIDNIVNTKFELLDSLNYEDTAILNNDNIYIKNKEIKNIENVIRISTTNKTETYYAQVINLIPLELIIYKNEKPEIALTTPLLGRHNALNILISYVVLQQLKEKGIIISKEKIKERIKNLSPTPHRLEYKKINNIHLYDDSYNSNIVGFINACEVIKELPYKKIIITPGIVELAKKEKEVSMNIAKTIKDTFDEIYIIKNKASDYLIDYLQDENLYITTSFKAAYNECVNKYKEEIAILIENDLPDNYLERW